MTKREPERALRLAARLARDDEFYVIGSQAAHAYCQRPPAEVRLSNECDLYPKNRPEVANLIAHEMGRRSKFARTHGFYIDVVTPDIATLPRGWHGRLKTFRVGRISALCLEVHDLMISKLAAGRLKDLEFVGAFLQLGFADVKTLRRRIGQTSSEGERSRMRARLENVLGELRR